ncbi:MAG: hypothetical protein N3G74_02090 [Candidatus Micrarchaeota archaeon]|nr:hypothetical protein [Candidatus Micrarchaeota archaeon]
MGKKGLFSIDASVAVIVVLTISILFYSIIQSFMSSLHNLDVRQRTASLIIFSNQIVRNEGAYKTNTETTSNLISMSELNSFISSLQKSNASDYGFDYVELNLSGRSGSVLFSSKSFRETARSETFCIDRFVVIKDLNEEGILRICAK